MPMIVGKHERTLAIDGPYIHVRFYYNLFPLFLLLNFVCVCVCVCVCVDHADDEQGRQSGL
jgi:hypothetical protein